MQKRINGTYYIAEAVPGAAAKKLYITSAYKTKNNTSLSGADFRLSPPPLTSDNGPELTGAVDDSSTMDSGMHTPPGVTSENGSTASPIANSTLPQPGKPVNALTLEAAAKKLRITTAYKTKNNTGLSGAGLRLSPLLPTSENGPEFTGAVDDRTSAASGMLSPPGSTSENVSADNPIANTMISQPGKPVNALTPKAQRLQQTRDDIGKLLPPLPGMCRKKKNLRTVVALRFPVVDANGIEPLTIRTSSGCSTS